jgi:hypothetical protein
MTPSDARTSDYPALLRGIAFAAGLLLLADSLSQLMQAAVEFNLGSRTWRVTHLRLLFTQVTPLTIGLLLVGQFLVQRRERFRMAGWIAIALGIVIAVLALVYLGDAVEMSGTLSGPPHGQLKRTSVQVLLSGSVFVLALVVGGGRMLRAARAS